MPAVLSSLKHKPAAPTPWRWVLACMLSITWLSLMQIFGWITVGIWELRTGTLPVYPDPAYNAVISNLVLILMLLGLYLFVIAWRQGFPAWSYPLAIQVVLVSLYLTNVSLPGFTIFGYSLGRQILGCWALLPLLVASLVAALLSRPEIQRPLVQATRDLRDDLPRLSLGLYAATPLLLRIVFDEVHGEELFLLLMDGILAAGVVIYLRSRRLNLRIAALANAMLVCWVASSVYLGIYWDGRQENWMLSPASGMQNLRGTLIFGLVVTAIVLIPVWIYLFNNRKKRPVAA